MGGTFRSLRLGVHDLRILGLSGTSRFVLCGQEIAMFGFTALSLIERENCAPFGKTSRHQQDGGDWERR